MDGKRSVAELVRIMEDAFPDETDRMLDRVVAFIATLQHNGFIPLIRRGRDEPPTEQDGGFCDAKIGAVASRLRPFWLASSEGKL